MVKYLIYSLKKQILKLNWGLYLFPVVLSLLKKIFTTENIFLIPLTSECSIVI